MPRDAGRGNDRAVGKVTDIRDPVDPRKQPAAVSHAGPVRRGAPAIHEAGAGDDGGAIADAHEGSALFALSLDPGEQRWVFEFNDGGNDHIVRALREAGVKIRGRGVRLHSQSRAQAQHAWLGGHGEHLGDARADKDPVGNGKVRQLGP